MDSTTVIFDALRNETMPDVMAHLDELAYFILVNVENFSAQQLRDFGITVRSVKPVPQLGQMELASNLSKLKKHPSMGNIKSRSPCGWETLALPNCPNLQWSSGSYGTGLSVRLLFWFNSS